MPSSRSRILAVLGLLGALGAAAVLYVIHARAVHATSRPPAALARLVPDSPPEPVSAVGFSEESGKRDTLATFRGRYVLLNLWATWCAPCVRELPQLARLKSVLPALAVAAINVGRDDAATTKAFLRGHGAGALRVYVDTDSALIRAFGTQGLPFSVLIDPQGRQIAHALGPCSWGTPDAVVYLRNLTTLPHASS